jgi:hypothetical protein
MLMVLNGQPSFGLASRALRKILRSCGCRIWDNAAVRTPYRSENRDREYNKRCHIEVVPPVAFPAAAASIDKAMTAGGRELPTLIECVAYGSDLTHAGEPKSVAEKEQGRNKPNVRLSAAVSGESVPVTLVLGSSFNSVQL